jgi:pimeloyl-ACP methyl ester carboxylesterase
VTAAKLSVARPGFELRGWGGGPAGSERPAILCLHETGTSAEVWRRFAEALSAQARVHAFDRRGWGQSGAPEDYRRTTIAEQAGDAEAVISSLGAAPLILCGAGIGAVIALELAVRREKLVSAALLVEPPLLALVPEATAVIAADVEAIRKATVAASRLAANVAPTEIATRRADAARELFRDGELRALGAGSERIPETLSPPEQRRSFALFAELAAIPNWSLPLVELGGLVAPVRVVVGTSTPLLVRSACEALAARLPGGDRRELPAAGLPQLDAAGGLAELALELV